MEIHLLWDNLRRCHGLDVDIPAARVASHLRLARALGVGHVLQEEAQVVQAV